MAREEIKEMKKKILLLLAVMLCVSLCACGGSETSNNVNNDKQNNTSEKPEEQEIKIEEGEYGLTVYLSREQLKECLTKVTITKENWRDYFSDYEYTEHIVYTNDFGDVEREYDELHYGFGIKKDINAVYKKVSFKFDGKTYTWTNRSNGEICKSIYEVGNNIVKIYDESGEWREYENDENKEYYLLELQHNTPTKDFYGDHECLDVIGEIIVVNLPFEEPYYGQIEFRFPDGKFSVHDMSYNSLNQYFEE